jgi:hypothetical protein
MDTYYNDKNCYPKLGSADVPISGDSWTGVNSAVYMQKVPVDPDPAAVKGTQNYAYVTDGTDCPQWNIIFAKVTNSAAALSTLCPLANLKDKDGNSCMPSDLSLTSRYNFCVLSGSVDCTTIENLKVNDPTSVPALGVGNGEESSPPGEQPPAGPPADQPVNSGSCPACSCSKAPYVLPARQRCNSQSPAGGQSPQSSGYCCMTSNGQCDTQCTP